MSNPFYVYILYSVAFDRYYVGQTSDLDARYTRHNKGYVKSTKKYVPWTLVWSIVVESRSESMRIESKIKTWKSSKKIKELVANKIDIGNL